MKLKTTIIATILLVATVSKAQKGSNYAKVGIGISSLFREAGNYNAGFNVVAADYIGITDKQSVVLTAGYNTFSYKTNTSFKASFLLATIGYRVFAKNSFYFQPHVGASINTGDYNKGKNGVGYGLAIGNVFGKNKTGLDAMLRYEGNSNTKSWLGLTLGYQFKVK